MFVYSLSKFTTRTVAVALVSGLVMLISGKKGGVMKYTFWPGFGKRPSIEKRVKDAIAPESSLPGRPGGVLLKREGMSGGVSDARSARLNVWCIYGEGSVR